MERSSEIVRPPAVAGQFYPAEPAELEREVQRYLANAEAPPAGLQPKALIAPHAGYVYSGPVAGSAYRALERVRERISRVVMLGPSHRVYLRGLAAPSAGSFLTPLGEIPVDRDALERVLRLPQVTLADAPHALEHSLEVQLPFLQRALRHFELVPLAVGEASDAEVAGVLDELWGGDETLVVVSSDLSHYLSYESARVIDAETSRSIEALDASAISPDEACGGVAVRGLLVAARRHGLAARTLDLRSSGDTAGPRHEVVGYGAYALQ
jgi:AmmeMemoRadiSam system protein B